MASLKELKTQFLEYVEIEKGRAIRTVENYDHYLTVFLKQTKVNNPKDITDAKVRERQIDVISQEELKRLLNAPNSEKNLEKKYRDKAIMEILFSTGLRVS